MKPTLRPATLQDIPAIRDIFNHYVATSTCTCQIEPDTEEDRATWFHDRGSSHPVIVAEMDGGVVGWAALSPWKSRCEMPGARRHRSMSVTTCIAEGLERRSLPT